MRATRPFMVMCLRRLLGQPVRPGLRALKVSDVQSYTPSPSPALTTLIPRQPSGPFSPCDRTVPHPGSGASLILVVPGATLHGSAQSFLGDKKGHWFVPKPMQIKTWGLPRLCKQSAFTCRAPAGVQLSCFFCILFLFSTTLFSQK